MLYSPLALDTLVEAHRRDLEREATERRARRSARPARRASWVSLVTSAVAAAAVDALRRFRLRPRVTARSGTKVGA